MGDKTVQKRALIVERARQVFSEKGFKDVTMKDIVEACEISRGGLYLYFESTAEIFRAVLEAENENADSVQLDIPEGACASDILMVFLKEQKKEILRKKGSLATAVYEYYFEVRPPRKENPLRAQFMTGMEFLTELIESGVENGEFYCEDPAGMARTIMFSLEGLRICAQTMQISEGMVDREMMFIMQNLVYEE